LADLVMRLLSKDPARRPGSAREVAEQLEEIERRLAAPEPSSQTQVLPPPAKGAPASSGQWKSLGVATAVALAVLLPVGYYFGSTLLHYTTNKGVLVVEEDDPQGTTAATPSGKGK